MQAKMTLEYLKILIKHEIEEITSIPTANIDDADRLYALGMDSLDIVDLEARLEKGLDATFPASLKIDENSTVAEAAECYHQCLKNKKR